MRSHTASAVKQPVSDLYGLIDLIRAGCVVHLPQPQTDLRHLVAIVKLDGRDVDRHGFGEIWMCQVQLKVEAGKPRIVGMSNGGSEFEETEARAGPAQQ